MTSPSVFLSYTKDDEVAARRVYDDLTRSGYDVWSYVVDAKLGADYQEEYEHELHTRDYFFLLDSPRARRSPHVRHECRLAQERQLLEPGFVIVPCVIAVRPRHHWWNRRWHRWRDWFRMHLLLPNQAKRQYVNLAHDYVVGMEKLCAVMGGRKFFPFSDLPEDEEFFEELSHSAGIPLKMYSELLGLYRRFRDTCGTEPKSARTWILSVIDVVEKSGAAGIATPWVALGVLLSEEGDFKGAANAFEVATRNRPDFDRAWCAAAAVNMGLGNYREALRHYEHCRQLLQPASHPNRDNLPIVVFGIGIALFRLGSPEKAAEALEREWTEVGRHGRILQLRAQLYLHAGSPRQALPLADQARAYFQRRSEPVPVGVYLAEAQSFRELGKTREEKRVVKAAVDQFERDPDALRSIVEQIIGGDPAHAVGFLRLAARVRPKSMVYRIELASVLYVLGEKEEARREASSCLWLEDELDRPLSSRERYYQGLSYRILGKSELAQHALERTRRQDKQFANWPEYEQVLRLPD